MNCRVLSKTEIPEEYSLWLDLEKTHSLYEIDLIIKYAEKYDHMLKSASKYDDIIYYQEIVLKDWKVTLSIKVYGNKSKV